MHTIAIILCVALAVFIAENCRELRTFRVKRYRITSRKLRGMGEKRILFLSDLHNCSYGEENMRLMQAIRKAKPDLILIGGDMLVRKNGTSYEKTVSFLRQLPRICPVYCANGNHEQKLKEKPERYRQSYKDYKALLTEAGVIFLENETAEFSMGKIRMRVTGLEIPLESYKKTGRHVLTRDEMEQRIGIPNYTFHILMAHNPAFMKVYLEWGADLILSGHLHGGMVRIPGLGGVISPDLRLFPRYSGGKYHCGNSEVVVSRGLGNHSIPIRFWNPAEMIELKLSGPKES